MHVRFAADGNWKTYSSEVYQLMRPRRGILLLGVVLMIVSRVAGMILPASMKVLVDGVLTQRNEQLIPPLVAAVIGGAVLQAAASFWLTRVLSNAAHSLVAEVRGKLQAHISRLPISFFDKNQSGNLVARVMSDVDPVRHLIGSGIIDLLGGLVTGTISVIVLYRINPKLTILALGFLAIFGTVVSRELRKTRPLFRKRSRINGEVTSRLAESFSGVRVIKGYRAEAQESAVFKDGMRRLLAATMQTVNILSLTGAISGLTFGCAGALVIYVGAQSVLQGHMTLGDLLTFSAFLMLLAAPALQAVQVGGQITEAFAALDRCREILRQLPEDQDPTRVENLSGLLGDVRLEGVCFEYQTGARVLHGVTFHAPPGTVTALVGPSGAGKTTISNLIASFYKPQSGRVLIDGRDLSAISFESYRRHLGMVLQETFLFDGTIRENVCFARPDASEEDFLNACRIACVDEFSARFENGYHTIVGERGVRLSGGQKQRVSIARAILANPRILILDEATSSLDSESEELIQQGLSYLLRGRTTLVIAHRLSTIRGADQILVIQDGVIVERGTHEDLYHKRGRYRDLYDSQHSFEADRPLSVSHV